VLPFADLPRDALHLGFEDLVGDPAQEIQGGGHWSAPVAVVPLTMVVMYSLLIRSDVIVITGIRFPFNYLIYNNKIGDNLAADRGIIGITGRCAAVEGLAIRWIERAAATETNRQIGIGKKENRKRD
jgi:hypothetical protein